MTQDQVDGQRASVAEIGKPARRSASRLLTYAAGAIIFVLVMLVLGVYLWKVMAVRSLEQKMEVQRNEMTEERRQALDLQARDMLRLTARPLAWAVRAEMLRNNLGQVDDYFSDFVREPGIVAVVLIGKDNTVLLASNRKLVTSPADDVVSKAVQEATDVVVEESGDMLRLAVPIMSFNERLAVLVVDYSVGAGKTSPAPVP